MILNKTEIEDIVNKKYKIVNDPFMGKEMYTYYYSDIEMLNLIETYIYEKKNVKIGTIKRPKGEICPSFANMLIKYGVNPIEVAHKMDDFNAMDVAFNIALNYYYKKYLNND